MFGVKNYDICQLGLFTLQLHSVLILGLLFSNNLDFIFCILCNTNCNFEDPNLET